MIVTSNMKRKRVVVEFDDEDPDFIRRNHYYTAGDFFLMTIKKDIEKVKLQIYKPECKKHRRIKERTMKKRESGKI